MKVSVIMLTFNRETLVSRAIDSVLAQTFRDFEFIIVNNGSTDRSGQIADEYAKKDSRIHVIHRERGNIGSGRNAGLDAAKGEYIAFIDDDDWCEPDFLEFLYYLAIDNNADVSICGAADKAFNEKLILTAEEALVELLWRVRYNMGFPTKMFSRELADKVRFSKTDKYDDISQMHRLLAFADKIVYHGLPKYQPKRHDNNNSAWTTAHGLLDSETLDEYLNAYRERTEWLSEMFPSSTDAWRYFEWSFMLSMAEKIDRFEIIGCERQHSAIVSVLRENRDEFLGSSFIQEFEKKWIDDYK